MSSPTATTVRIERGRFARLHADGAPIVTQSLINAELVALCTDGATYWISDRDYWRAVAGETIEATLLEAPEGARVR